MGKHPIGFAAHFDVKPLIPNNREDKFSHPPKKKKFRLKLRSNGVKSEHKVKIEKKQSFYGWELKPMFYVKEEPQIFIKKEPAMCVPKYKPKLLPRKEECLATPWGLPEEPDFTDPTYTPLSDEFSLPSSDDETAYFRTNDVLRIKPVNTRKVKVKKEKERKHRKKAKKPRRRYKRKVLTDSEKLQASRRRRTCLVKKPKSQYLGVSWCNTKNTWVARVWHPTERKLIWAGYHANERACALAVNSKCLDLKIPLKNPHIVGH